MVKVYVPSVKWVNNVKVEDDKLVVIENDQPITLLYKITITALAVLTYSPLTLVNSMVT